MPITNLSQISHVKDIFAEQVGDHELLQPAWVNSSESETHVATPADLGVIDDSLISALIPSDANLHMITAEDMDAFLARLPEDQRGNLLDMLHRGHFEPMSWKQAGGMEAQMPEAYYVWVWYTRQPDGSLRTHYYPLSQTVSPMERCEMAAYSCDLLEQLEGGAAGGKPVETSSSGLPSLQERIDGAATQSITLSDGSTANVISIQTLPQEFVQMHDLHYHLIYDKDGNKFWQKVE